MMEDSSMYRITALFFSLITLLFSPNLGFTVDGSGGQAGAFLRIPVGARPAGMGNAFTAISDDANAMYFNPGGLYQIEKYVFGGMYSFLSMDRNHYQGSFAFSPKKIGTISVMFVGFGVSNIEGRDNLGLPTGKFSDSENAISIGYGKKILSILGVGTNIKYLSHSLKSSKASGVGFDLGLHSRIPIHSTLLQSIRLGASVTDLGEQLKWNTNSSLSEDIPSTLRYGAGFDLMIKKIGFLLSVEESTTTNESSQFHGGVETWIHDVFSIRTGYDKEGVSFGASIKFKSSQFDYAYSPDILDEGSTMKCGVQISF